MRNTIIQSACLIAMLAAAVGMGAFGASDNGMGFGFCLGALIFFSWLFKNIEND